MKKTLLVITTCLVSPLTLAKTVEVSSPDKQIVVTIDDSKTPSYQINFNNQTALEASRLGLRFKKSAELGEGFAIGKTERNTSDTSWQLPWGERKNVRDHHNELLVTFNAEREASNQFSVRF